MENLERLLAELFNDASTHTTVPPSSAQAEVVKEQQPLKLQTRHVSYIHGWETNLIAGSVVINSQHIED